MSDPANNGAQRLTPEQSFSRQLNELAQRYMMTGGSVEYVLGAFKICEIFYTGPHQENSIRQAQQVALARSARVPKEGSSDGQGTELPPR